MVWSSWLITVLTLALVLLWIEIANCDDTATVNPKDLTAQIDQFLLKELLNQMIQTNYTTRYSTLGQQFQFAFHTKDEELIAAGTFSSYRTDLFLITKRSYHYQPSFFQSGDNTVQISILSLEQPGETPLVDRRTQQHFFLTENQLEILQNYYQSTLQPPQSPEVNEPVEDSIEMVPEEQETDQLEYCEIDSFLLPNDQNRHDTNNNNNNNNYGDKKAHNWKVFLTLAGTGMGAGGGYIGWKYFFPRSGGGVLLPRSSSSSSFRSFSARSSLTCSTPSISLPSFSSWSPTLTLTRRSLSPVLRRTTRATFTTVTPIPTTTIVAHHHQPMTSTITTEATSTRRRLKNKFVKTLSFSTDRPTTSSVVVVPSLERKKDSQQQLLSLVDQLKNRIRSSSPRQLLKAGLFIGIGMTSLLSFALLRSSSSSVSPEKILKTRPAVPKNIDEKNNPVRTIVQQEQHSIDIANGEKVLDSELFVTPLLSLPQNNNKKINNQQLSRVISQFLYFQPSFSLEISSSSPWNHRLHHHYY
jgi:hypothetical protein